MGVGLISMGENRVRLSVIGKLIRLSSSIVLSPKYSPVKGEEDLSLIYVNGLGSTFIAYKTDFQAKSNGTIELMDSEGEGLIANIK